MRENRDRLANQMENEIIDKIKFLLNENVPLKEEAHIVYLFVEIRKVLDLRNNPNYPVLRFYCDWSVHTKKDRITPAIKSIMERIYSEVQERDKAIKNGGGIISRRDSMEFSSMDCLKVEMETFFNSCGVSKEILDQKNWVSFVKTFVKVLAEQEIENPCGGIRYFKFLTTTGGHTRWKISYKIKEAGYGDYEFEDPYN